MEKWLNRPDTASRRVLKSPAASAPTHGLVELVEQFCRYQYQQRGKTSGGIATYRWNLEQFLRFVESERGQAARVRDVNEGTIQAWMDDMAEAHLALSTLRTRQASLSSFCNWLVKRRLLAANPITCMDRPPHQRVPPAVPAPPLMDALVLAAKERGRPRDFALFLLLRYTGMRRESVATLRVGQLDGEWGLRGVHTKGGKVRDIPVPGPVMQFLHASVQRVLLPNLGSIARETPLFWSTWGRKAVGKIRQPMTGKNVWRLCKVYGRRIGYPTLKPHDLRHGVAMEVLGQRNNLEEVRALLGHTRLETTQIYTMIRPPQLKRAVAFYDGSAARLLHSSPREDIIEETSV
jgi:site-specific recombinase XerD